MTESVVATAIIAICILLAVRIYAMVLSNTDSNMAMLSKIEVDILYSEVKSKKDFEPSEHQYERFKIVKKIRDYEGGHDLKELSFVVQGERDTITYKFLVTDNTGL